MLLQAEANLKFVNKSWIVIPLEKKTLILEKYKNYLDNKKYVGVIGVTEEGRYEIIYQPQFKKLVLIHQQILNLCMM